LNAAQSLFPDPIDSEQTWFRKFEVLGEQTVDVPLYISLIKSELRDQVSIKGSVRKAALRNSQKQITRYSKIGIVNLSQQQLDELRWSLFICHVDEVISGRHMHLRNNVDELEALCDNQAFKAN